MTIGKACVAVGVAVLMIVALGAASKTRLLSGQQGLEPVTFRDLPTGTVIDSRSAGFRVLTSAQPNPVGEASCETGVLPVNRYPFRVYDSARITMRGGLFAGEVSLAADWEAIYCNSAAVRFSDSPDAVVEGVRIRRVWDGFRFSGRSDRFLLRDAWISDARDDCVENDYLNGGMISDVLFDGCFSGISVRPPEGAVRAAAGGPLILEGVLMRMESFLYKSRLKQGVPLKAAVTAPQLEIYDSVVAMSNSSSVSKTRLGVAWDKISQCDGNLLLWTSDEPWPDSFDKPPACFRLVQGAPARSLWQRIRKNWIDCHPSIPRFEDDLTSDPAACDDSNFGRPTETDRGALLRTMSGR